MSKIVISVLVAAALAGVVRAAPPAVEHDTRGFLYGRVTTRGGGEYVGRLRWGREEAFWGDHLNGTKAGGPPPWAARLPAEAGTRREPIEVLGVRLGVRWSQTGRGRMAAIPFGQVRRLEPRGKDDLRVVLENGSVLELDGGSNDIGATVRVWDASLGRIALDWDRIVAVDFLPAPADLDVGAAYRLHGTVESESGTFTGFIQWDVDESLSTDVLDGEERGRDLEIAMGEIRTIERRSRKSARVVLESGAEHVLSGTNDVDERTAGIFVEDRRYGRVLVSWDAFERLTLDGPRGSGPAKGDFAPAKALRGTVEEKNGARHRGRIVYDLDESEDWEMLNGNDGDVEYHIPFALIARIVPNESGSEVFLRGGERLELEGEVDVGRGNAGLLIIGDGDGDSAGSSAHVRWGDVASIAFD